MKRTLAPALLLGLLAASAATLAPGAPAAVERAMFGNTFARNMVSDEKGLPGDWDVKTGRNVRWWADVGSQAYAGPVIAGGKVFVGTNNDGLRNPALPNDRGVVMAFAEATGEFLWQMTHEKLTSGRVNDWPQQGVCSTPFVEGKRLYYVSMFVGTLAGLYLGYYLTDDMEEPENRRPFQRAPERSGAVFRFTLGSMTW